MASSGVQAQQIFRSATLLLIVVFHWYGGGVSCNGVCLFQVCRT